MTGYTSINKPWAAKNSGGVSPIISHSVLDSNGDIIAHCFSAFSPLIAAAPELLEELENANALIAILRSFLGPDNDYYALINEHMAKSAPLIAKAKGES